MPVLNSSAVDALANMSQLTYAPTTTVGPVQGAVGTYKQITQLIDGPLGFQARAFFNNSSNDLVIAFTGTEGFGENLQEFVPDAVAGLTLLAAGTSPQNIAAQAFVTQALFAAQAEVGFSGSFDTRKC